MITRSKMLFPVLICVFFALTTIIGIAFHHSAESSDTKRSDTHTAQEAWNRLQNGEIMVVDIRRPEEWLQTGSPRNSLRLSFEQHPEGADGFLRDLNLALDGDKTKPLAIICRTGNRTKFLLPFLHANGFSGAMAIPEGMAGSSHGKGWLRNDLPVDR